MPKTAKIADAKASAFREGKSAALTLAERIERKTLIKSLHALPALRRLRREKDALGKDACHKLARKIAREARGRMRPSCSSPATRA